MRTQDDKTKWFEGHLVETFSEHCDSGLYILKYYLLGHMGKDIRQLRTLSALDSSPYEHLHVQIEQAYRRISRRRRARIVETLNVIKGDCDRCDSDEKNGFGE